MAWTPPADAVEAQVEAPVSTTSWAPPSDAVEATTAGATQAPETPPAQEGFFDKLGTGMNVVRDWATGATKPRGSVLETIGRPTAPSVATEDPMLQPQFVQAVEARLNALPENQRKAALDKMLKRPDVYGRAAKVVAGRYAGLEQVVSPTLKKLDPRLEAQKARFEEQGLLPDIAEGLAKQQALSGELRPDLQQMTADVVGEKASAEAAKRAKELQGSDFLDRVAAGARSQYTKSGIGLLQAYADITGDEGFSAGLTDALRVERAREGAIPEGEGIVGKSFQSAMTSLAGQAPLLALSVVTGTTAPVLAQAAIQQFGDSYSEGKAAGLPGAEAATRAIPMAAAEVFFERFGMTKALAGLRAHVNKFGTASIPKYMATAIASEIPPELATTATQYVVNAMPKIGLEKNPSLLGLYKELEETLRQTVLQAGVTAGVTVGASKGAQAIQNRLQAEQRQGYTRDASTDGLAELMARSKGFLAPEGRPTPPTTDLGELGAVVPGEDREEQLPAYTGTREKFVEKLVADLEASGVPFEDAVEIAERRAAEAENKQEKIAAKVPKVAAPTNRVEELTDDLIAAGFPPKEAKERATAIAEQEARDDAEAESTGDVGRTVGAGTGVAGKPAAGPAAAGPETPARTGVAPTGQVAGVPDVGEGAQPGAVTAKPPKARVSDSGAYIPSSVKGEDPVASAGFKTLDEDNDLSENLIGATFITGMNVSARGQGAGNTLLKGITSWADENGKTLVLVPAASPDEKLGGLSQGQLKDWYKRNGFEDRVDYMVRPPATQEGAPSGTETSEAKQAETQGQEATKTDVEVEADKARADIAAGKKRGRPALKLTPEQKAEKDKASRQNKTDYMRASRAADKQTKALEDAINTGNQTKRRAAYKELLRLQPSFRGTALGNKIKATLETHRNRFMPAEIEAMNREIKDEAGQALPSVGETTYKADPKLGKVTNGAQAIAQIIKTGNPFQKLLAQRIRGFVNGVKIVVVEKGDSLPARLQSGRAAKKWPNARGMYVPSEKTVYIRGASFGDSQGVNNVTILHELLHAATAQKLKLGMLALERGWSLDNAVTRATVDLQRVMSNAKERFDELLAAGKLPAYIQALNQNANVFSNPDEFLAYGMSDDAMQTFLLGAKGTEGGNFFSRFVDSVRNFFGMGADSMNALADLVLVTDKLLSARKSPTMRFLEAADRATAEREGRVLPSWFGKGKTEEPTAQTTSTRVQPSANVARLAKMLGSKLYGTPDDIARVSLKEIFQNSFDAIKEGLEKVNEPWHITKGSITIKADESNRSLTITDNGPGMPTSVMGNQFLQIAGTVKGTSRASGGLGVAKMLFLFENKKLEVVSLRDGVLSRMTTTGEDLKAALDDPDRGPVITTSTDPKTIEQYKKTLFPDGHGTAISVQIPESYIDESTGESKSIPFSAYDLNYSNVLEHSPLFGNIEVEFENVSRSGYTTSLTLDIGSKFPASEYTAFANVRFAWGTARIYVSRKEADAWGNNTYILSNGLWQFSRQIKDGPGYKAKNIKRRFYIDVSPSENVKPEDPGYPFELNRQNFSKSANEDFEKIFNYISALYRQVDFASEVKNYGTVQYVDANGTLSPRELLEPVAPPTDSALTLIKEGDSVEVRDGVLYVNNREIPELTNDDLKNTSLKVEELTIPQDQIDPNRVMVHDNAIREGDDTDQGKSDYERLRDLEFGNIDKYTLKSFRAKEAHARPYKQAAPTVYDFSINNDDGTITTFTGTAGQIAADLEELGILQSVSISGKSLSDIARAKFGKRYDQYLHRIGKVFMELRDQLVAIDYEYQTVPSHGKARLLDIAIGVSIDTKYFGVSTRIPFEAMLLNPASTELRGSPAQIAVSMLGTMQHELAHFRVRSHDADFASEMQRINNLLATVGGSPKWMDGVRDSFISFMGENADIFDFLHKEFSSGNYEPAGNRLKDAGAYQARNESTINTVGGTYEAGGSEGLRVLQSIEQGAPSTGQVGVGEGDVDEDEEVRAERSQKQLDKDVAVAEQKVALSRDNEKLAKAAQLLQLARNPKNIIPQLRLLWKNASYYQRNALVRLPTMEFLVNWANTAVPELRNTYELMQKMSGMTQQILRSSGVLTTDIHRAFLEDSALRERLEDLALASTIAQVDPSDPTSTQRSAKLDADYAALGNKGQELYKRIKTHFENLSNLYSKLLDDQIKNSNMTPEQKDNIMVKLREMYETGKKITPYFPLVRRGDYWLAIGSGKNRQFYMYESLAERDTAMMALANKFIYQKPNESASDFEIRKKEHLNELIQDKTYEIGNDINSLRRTSFDSSLLLRGVFDSIDSANLGEEDAKEALKDAIYQMYLQTMPEQSFRKQFISRKNTTGFSTDLVRNVSATTVKMATQLARIKYAPLIRNSLSAAKDSIAGRPDNEPFVTEMERRAAKTLGFQTETIGDQIASMFNKASFFFYLGGASSALLQPISVFQTGMPVLAGRYGSVNATREMSKMMRVWSQFGMWRNNADGSRSWVAPSIENAKGLTPEERKAVRGMAAYGVAESTFARALYEYKNSPTERLSGPKVQMTKDAVSAAVLGGLMHPAERISRELIFLTSFRLNMKQHGDFNRAVREAVNDTNEALGNYGAYNRPRYMQTNVGKVLTQFQMYPLQVTMFLLNNFKQMIAPMDGRTRGEAFVKFFGTMFTTSILAGAVGLPVFSTIMGLVGAFWREMDDEKLLPEELKNMDPMFWFRTVFLPSQLGDVKIGDKKLSAIIERGPINALTGLDIGGRTGMSNLWFRDTKETKTVREEIMAMAIDHAGPGVNMILSFADAYDAFASGDYKKGTEKLLPAGFRNFAVAHKYATEGAKDVKGAPIMSKDAFTTGELIGQSIGFRSDLLANAQYVNFKAIGLEQRIVNQRTKLMNSLDRDFSRSNFKEFTDVLKDIHKFNMKYPSYEITEENITGSLEKRAEQRASSFKGVTLTEKNVPVFMKALAESRKELAEREKSMRK